MDTRPNAAVRLSAAPGGVCAVVEPQDASLALALAGRGRFVVQCLAADAGRVAALRRAIRSQGEYGVVSAHTFAPPVLPYAENLLNVVVVNASPAGRRVSAVEVLRVLAPLGAGFLGADETRGAALLAELRRLGVKDARRDGPWVCFTKPWPADIDEWTHYLHGADGNPVANDRVVGPAAHFQWISKPLWLRSHETDTSISTLVTARGRLFFIEDEAPISLAGMNSVPDKWFLKARDAFNGVLLWKVPIRRWGWREWKNSWFSCRPGDIPLNIRKRIVAAGDRVYATLGYHAPVSELDARTGDILKTYPETERAGELLYCNGTLVVSVLRGDGGKMMAVDAASGKVKWVTEKIYRGTTVDYVRWRAMHGRIKPVKLDPALNPATDGRTIALIDGKQIVALDFATGQEKWRAGFPSDPADLTAGGIQSKGVLWNGTMIVARGVVLHASPYKLAGFDADTGKLLWSQPKKYIGHLWYEWKDVFVIGDLVWTWSADFDTATFDIGRRRKQRERWPRTVNGYDIRTGKLVKKVPLGAIYKTYHHHRCYRNKATVRYILSSRRGTEYVDLLHGKHVVANWIRGACHVGMMPANGLQYALPHPCRCYSNEKLNGFIAAAPAIPERCRRGPAKGPRLERGPAYRAAPGSESLAAAPGDWPAFRCDASRSGACPASAPAGLRRMWRARVGLKVSPPVVARGRLYAALVDEHQVVCLDARTGETLWKFTAGGRVDSPPTYYRGALLFGCTDGTVYCLRASDGALCWRFRAAPQERFIAAFGQLESAWPVHGSVLVQNGLVYFPAGRSSEMDGGIYLYALDSLTGDVRHQTRLEGPHYTVDNIKENFKLPMGALSDILIGDGRRVFMHTSTFNDRLEPAAGAPPFKVASSFLDDSYFKRAPWTDGRRGYGRLLVRDKRSVYFVRQFDTLRGLDPTVYFVPGRKGYLLFARRGDSPRMAWSERVRVRIRAMAIAGDKLIVAGPPDEVNPKDPLAAFEGRDGGWLYVCDAKKGEILQKLRLPSPPVFNGVAAAQGIVYLVSRDGAVSAFAGPKK